MMKLLGAVCLSLVMVVSAMIAPQQDESKSREAKEAIFSSIAPYDIVVDFYLDHESFMKYPKVAVAFNEAMREWVRVMPIQIRVLPNGLEEEDLDERVIKVKILEGDASGDDNILGRWLSKKKTITLIGPKLKDNKLMAKIVAMHEIGHAFGLPHVVNQHEFGKLGPGGIVLRAGDAKTYLMYPHMNRDHGKVRIQLDEAMMAWDFIRVGISRRHNASAECYHCFSQPK